MLRKSSVCTAVAAALFISPTAFAAHGHGASASAGALFAVPFDGNGGKAP
jgi:hypothetical protein